MSLLKKFDTDTIQKGKKKVLPLIVTIFLIGIIFELWAVNRLSTDGEKIAKYTREAQQLTLENQLLGDQIAEKSSFYQVALHAHLLGFSDIARVQYIQPLDLAFSH